LLVDPPKTQGRQGGQGVVVGHVIRFEKEKKKD
jgi:hypothetical protein